MPALFFPNLDTLRLAIASALVPHAVTLAPVRIGSDASGHVWLETDDLPPRESLTALARVGVQVLGAPGVPTRSVRCWAEVLPLRRTDAPAAGLTLFDVPDSRLANFVGFLRRLSKAPVGVHLLAEPHAGRAWVTILAPSPAMPLLDDPDANIRIYRQQIPNVWTVRGWEHPLAEHLVVPTGGILLCDPDRGVCAFDDPVPQPLDQELPLPPHVVVASGSGVLGGITVCFRLNRRHEAGEETLWVLTPAERDAFREFCHGADERLLRRFELASVGADDQSRLVVRRVAVNDRAAHLPVVSHGFQADPRLPWLFVPAGFSLRPLIRVNELAREFAQGADRLVWVEAAEGGVAVHAVAESAFHPLWEQVEYAARERLPLTANRPSEAVFTFERFALQVETTIDLEPEPEPVGRPEEEAPAATENEPGWVSKSVARMFWWVRGRRQEAEHESSAQTNTGPREPRPHRRTGERQPGRVERKLASADALLHGHDWASRRHELETRLLSDFPRLAPDSRATRWAELASVYAATGQSQDAAVCWTNALWDCANPPETWLEQWVTAECRAAKRSDWAGDLERWLGEPGRPGTGRVVAALAALHGFRPTTPPEISAALPRVLAILEQQFDDIPVRAAWLARLAVARSCDGDTLGVARWRDRLIRRLHDRGPGLDLDEPSFLRFRGRATAERFKVARESLTRLHDPVRAWVEKHVGSHKLSDETRASLVRENRRNIPGLQAVGLGAETKATVEYAKLMLAWGLGVLGERGTSRDWAARARKALSRASGPRTDPAGHAFLGDLFLHRIKDAHEGHAAKPALPADLQARYEKLPDFARYSVDRLREHSRILQPVGSARAYRGLDVKEFWGTDRLGERLSVLGARTDPADVNEEARALLAIAIAEPTTATVPRIAFALLEVAAYLDAALLELLLELVPTALDWIETWVYAGRWTDAERAERVSRFRSRILDAAFAAAPAHATERLLRELLRHAAAGRMLPAITASAPRVFRAARRYELTASAEALIQALDFAHGVGAEQALTAERVGLAAGWFVAGDEEAGHRIINAARDALFFPPQGDDQQRTALALAYAEALGFAPAGIALGRLEEIFQLLGRVTVHCSSNCYFTLHPLRLVDTVVRSIVTDEFTLSPAVRAWLDEDEFLIRRRIHRDMAGLLRESELG